MPRKPASPKTDTTKKSTRKKKVEDAVVEAAVVETPVVADAPVAHAVGTIGSFRRERGGGIRILFRGEFHGR